VIFLFSVVHVIRAWRKRIDKLGIKTLLNKDNSLKKFWAVCKGLPYLPLSTPWVNNHVVQLLTNLRNKIIDPDRTDGRPISNESRDKFEKFYQYIINNYVKENELYIFLHQFFNTKF